jgi:hypothetical protein
MEVLVYINPVDVSKKPFFEQISKAPALSPTLVLERDQFKSLIMQKALDRGAVVFFAYDQDDLAAVLSVKQYMTATQVILVLRKFDAGTVHQGLTMSPCIITHAKSNFNDIVAVLEKINALEEQPTEEE